MALTGLTKIKGSTSKIAATGTDKERKLSDRFGSLRNIKDYGASVDGVSDDSAYVNTMASDLGYVRFPQGDALLSGITIDVPVFFDIGAAVKVDVGNALTITSSIESARQHIFKGEGAISLSNDGDSGEDSRRVHASWFGIFTRGNDDTLDQAPLITKAFSAMGNARESIIDFDIGGYSLHSEVIVTRGGWVRGSGTRRTIFRLVGDGFNGFRTNEVACQFTDFQFELPAGTTERATGCSIRVDHGEAVIERVNVAQAENAFIINANNCRIKEVLGFYGNKLLSGSSVVNVISGRGTEVDGIILGTSASSGPESLVLIGGANQVGSISNVSVKNLNYITVSTGVSVDARTANIGSINIDDIRSNGTVGVFEGDFIKLSASGSYVLSSVNINNCITNEFTINGVSFNCDSTNGIKNVQIDNLSVSGSTGSCISFNRTVGQIENIFIGDGVNALSKTTPIAYNGGGTNNINISPFVFGNVNPSYNYQFSMEDDTAISIELNKRVFTGLAFITVQTSEYGQFVTRAANSAGVLTIVKSANVSTSTSVLTGTTGVDGEFTFSCTDGFIHLENRLGGSRAVCMSLMNGAK